MQIHPIIVALMKSLSEEQKAQIWATDKDYVNYYIGTPGTQVHVTIRCSDCSLYSSSISLPADDSRAILNELHAQGIM